MTTSSTLFAFCKIIVGLLVIVPGVISLILTLSLKPTVRQNVVFSTYESLPFLVSSLLACLLILVSSLCPSHFLGTGPRAKTKAIIGLLYAVAFNAIVFLLG